MPVPNKFTIYGYRITKNKYNDATYDGFLPRLYGALERKGVKFVNIYDKFMKSDELIYWQEDTHWNQTGRYKALMELIDFYKHDKALSGDFGG